MTSPNVARRSRRVLVSLLVAVSLVIGGSVTAAAFVEGGFASPFEGPSQRTKGGAEAAVEQYLGYLARGDAEAATKVSNPEVEPECEIFLTNDVFSKAKHHIADVEITSVEVDEHERYSVAFTYVLGGAGFSSEIEAWIDFESEQWTMDPLVQPLRVDTGGGFMASNFSISGIDRVYDPSQYCEPVAYPAVYQIDPPTNGFLVVEATELTVPLMSEPVPLYRTPTTLLPSVSLEFAAADSVLPTLQEQFSREFDECLTVDGLFDSTDVRDICFKSAYLGDATDVTNLQVEVLEYPVVAITGVYADGVSYSVRGGKLKLSYSGSKLYPRQSEIQTFTDVEEYLRPDYYSFVARFVDGKLDLGPFS